MTVQYVGLGEQHGVGEKSAPTIGCQTPGAAAPHLTLACHRDATSWPICVVKRMKGTEPSGSGPPSAARPSSV